MAINLSGTQTAELLAVLIQNIQVPFPNASSTGIRIVGSNTISIPDNQHNQILASQLNAYVSAEGNIHVSLVEGEPASGQ